MPPGVRGAAAAEWLRARAEPVAELRRRGHEIEESAGGLRLACAARHFDPARFERLRASVLGTRLEVWESATSTNDLARAGADPGSAAQVWLAEAQRSGRGRQGRDWICAPHSGLLFSFRVKSELMTASRPTLLPLAVGLGAARGAQAATGRDVRTKWPNDLWLDGRKLGGVLVEARPGAGGWAVVGVGINCDPAAIAGADLPRATTLAPGVRREALLAELLHAIETAIDDWRCGRFEKLHAAWSERDCLLGTRVQVETAAGTMRGRACAITDLGMLRLELDSGESRDLAAGEVHTLP